MTKQWYETVSFTIKDSNGRDQVVHTQPMALYAAVLKNAQDGVEQGKSSYRLCKAPRGRNCSKRLATPNLKETAYMPAKKTGLGGGMVIPAFYPAVKYSLITLIGVTAWHHLQLAWRDYSAIAASMGLGLLALGIIILIGMPMAWWLSQATDRKRSLSELLMMSPLLTSPLAIGILLVSAFGPYAEFDRWVSLLGASPGTAFAFSPYRWHCLSWLLP